MTVDCRRILEDERRKKGLVPAKPNMQVHDPIQKIQEEKEAELRALQAAQAQRDAAAADDDRDKRTQH